MKGCDGLNFWVKPVLYPSNFRLRKFHQCCFCLIQTIPVLVALNFQHSPFPWLNAGKCASTVCCQVTIYTQKVRGPETAKQRSTRCCMGAELDTVPANMQPYVYYITLLFLLKENLMSELEPRCTWILATVQNVQVPGMEGV